MIEGLTVRGMQIWRDFGRTYGVGGGMVLPNIQVEVQIKGMTQQLDGPWCGYFISNE